jgi:hypothetical protein
MLRRLKTLELQNRTTTLSVIVIILIFGLLLASSVVTFAGFFIDRVNDPLVTYYGEIMRRSTLFEQTSYSLYCQQLSSFSFNANFACFDSQQELDAFAVSRR